MNKKSKNTYLLVILTILVVVILLILISMLLLKNTKNNSSYEEFKINTYKFLNTYEEYQNINLNTVYDHQNLTENDFKNNTYLLVTYAYDSCGESIERYYYETKSNQLNIYYDIKATCGVCAREERTDIIKIKNKDYQENINFYYRVVEKATCDRNVSYKPMIYIYPTKDLDLTITLKNTHLLTSTYPKYESSWDVFATTDGNIYDKKTKRNYYGLYWEAIDDTPLDMHEGFVISGKDTIKFLEEKLSILGLNDYEINEFIVYWISKLENNNYNFIRFRTKEEINNYMPLEFSKTPDTIIRIMMDYKPLDKKITVAEQKLTKQERKGFTIVEWGATPHLK